MVRLYCFDFHFWFKNSSFAHTKNVLKFKLNYLVLIQCSIRTPHAIHYSRICVRARAQMNWATECAHKSLKQNKTIHKLDVTQFLRRSLAVTHTYSFDMVSSAFHERFGLLCRLVEWASTRPQSIVIRPINVRTACVRVYFMYFFHEFYYHLHNKIQEVGFVCDVLTSTGSHILILIIQYSSQETRNQIRRKNLW